MALLELEFRLVDATAALFFYDYSLTIWNEIIYVRREPRISIVKVCYFFARYGAMAGTILVMLPDNSDSSTLKSGISTILRLIPIVASELLVAIRTWAIWCRSRAIFLLLVGLAVIAIVPGVIIIGENIASDHLVALVGPEFIDLCSNIVGNHPHDYIIIYILVMLYEFVTLTLSLVRIINWRKSIPENIRAPLIDTLQRDDLLGYFRSSILFVHVGLRFCKHRNRAAVGAVVAVVPDSCKWGLMTTSSDSNDPLFPFLHSSFFYVLCEPDYMSSTALLMDYQTVALVDCVVHGQMGQGVKYATAALFFYDYSLTIWDEIEYVRREPRISIAKACYFLARYGAMAGTILVMLPNNSDSSTLTNGVCTILRLIPIVASELLVAIRTWAIWCRSRAIFLLLVVLAVHLRDIDAPGCSVLQTEIKTEMMFAARSRISRITTITFPETEEEEEAEEEEEKEEEEKALGAV
ncbi:hypothetical protein D9757_009944 [Collybiopsis confluens]|uniref:DUF6533 domain-containing protein n=1 Tax=Collybiopsis confluens TaxID=2823264 RepID=A0A8H5LZP2_9AGAR|nr:hypothetical protein D9757_009944 [Collybiopsis confluens]